MRADIPKFQQPKIETEKARRFSAWRCFETKTRVV